MSEPELPGLGDSVTPIKGNWRLADYQDAVRRTETKLRSALRRGASSKIIERERLAALNAIARLAAFEAHLWRERER